MSNRGAVDIITFFVYIDGIAKHTYGMNGIVKYEVITLYPKNMFSDVTRVVNAFRNEFDKTTKISVNVADCLPINRSTFALEYGLRNANK